MSKPKTKSNKPKPTAAPTSSPGVADYFNGKPQKTRSVLIALAADILILARCEGAPATARYFSEKLNAPVTEKMIKIIKSKAAKGEIVVTKKELVNAAMSHPITAARVKREPSLCEIPAPTIPKPPSAQKSGIKKKGGIDPVAPTENESKVLVTLTIAAS